VFEKNFVKRTETARTCIKYKVDETMIEGIGKNLTMSHRER
jgi:hypothetical protein